MGNFESPLSEEALKQHFHPPVQRSVLYNKAALKKKPLEKQDDKYENDFKRIGGRSDVKILVRNPETKPNQRSFDQVLNREKHTRKKQNQTNRRNPKNKRNRRQRDRYEYRDSRDSFDNFDSFHEDDRRDRKIKHKYPKYQQSQKSKEERSRNSFHKQDSKTAKGSANNNVKPKPIKQPRRRYRNKKVYKQVTN